MQGEYCVKLRKNCPGAVRMRRKKSGGFLNSNLQANIMRCPKCDYISFDLMEICGDCKKNIAKFSSELSGVVFKAETPDFLWFVKPQEEEKEEEAAADEEEAEEEPADTDEDGLDYGGADDDQENTVEFAADEDSGLDLGEAAEDETKEIEFDLGGGDDEPAAEEEAKEEIAFDLPGAEEDAAPSLELDSGSQDEDDKLGGLQLDSAGAGSDLSVDGLDGLDFDLESTDEPKPKAEKEKAGGKKKAAAKEPSLDLSGIDLSGLMPPAPEKEKLDLSFSGIGELSLEDGAAADSGPTTGKGKGGGKKSGAADKLPDLSIDGLDLNAATLPPAKSAAGKKMRPAAKTGTALDEFNIDLGDLLGGGGKKK